MSSSASAGDRANAGPPARLLRALDAQSKVMIAIDGCQAAFADKGRARIAVCAQAFCGGAVLCTWADCHGVAALHAVNAHP